ncbi:MAG: crotonase/enoyl-CoA hydratase family protein [Gammaproteobacteria bacterium]|nr:crotonase/enoyl-CoA hydratase family protein [Gammaproteobacteria bacterium]
MKHERVKISINAQIARVVLSRPDKHNALDINMFQAIDAAIKKIKKNNTIRVVIVSGEGKSFCSGLDVKSIMKQRSAMVKLLWKWWPGNANLAQRVSIGWRKLSVPVIMELHGSCWGGGLQIALGGDFRIASPYTSLSIMEAKWGLIPDMGGTPGLMENVPLDQAMQMAMTANTMSANEALEKQLITQIADDPEAAANILAEKLIERSPDTNKRIKHLYHKIWCNKQGKVLAGETYNQLKILLGKNQQIAVKKALGDNKIEYR